METKKAAEADLERRRPEGFLLGLVFALALLLAGLQYTAHPGDGGTPEEMLDDLAEDMEFMPALDTHDMVSAAPAPASKTITERVEETERPVDAAERVAPTTSELLVGNGEGVAEEAHVTEALPQTVAENEDEVMRQVEQLPEFPGGMVEFMKWLTRNLRYPDAALRGRVEGRVVVTFIVNKDGSIASPKVDRAVNPLLDAEALRVVKMMPRWKPGTIANKPCRTMIAIPVNFKI